MIFRWILFIALFIYGVHSDAQPCKPDLNLAYIEKNQFIGIARLYDEHPYINGKDILVVKKVFKGEPESENHVVLIDTVSGFYYTSNVDYLIYAYVKGEKNTTFHLYLDACTRTAPVEEVKDDLVYLDQNIKCAGEPSKHGCLRGASDGICGCDGISYPNSCEARLHGIYVYTIGRCKD
jgi:hypothetical protein